MPREAEHQPTPEWIRREQLVLSADVLPAVGVVWAVRRPTSDAKTYRVDLWYRPLPRGASRRIALPFGPVDAPRLVPGGDVIVVGDAQGVTQVWRVTLSGGRVDRLTGMPHGVRRAVPSPAGDRVAFVSPTDPPRFLVGSDRDPVCRRVRSHLSTADGLGFRDRWHHLFVIGDGGLIQLTSGEYDVQAFDWSPDGRWLWFTADRRREPLVEIPRLWKIRPRDGAVPQLVAEAEGPILDAAWSPDGRWLAYLARTPAEWAQMGLFVAPARRRDAPRRIDHGLCVEQATFPDLLPLPDAATGQLAWEEDSRAVLAIATVAGEARLYRFPLDGEPVEVVPNLTVGAVRRRGAMTVLVGAGPGRAADAHLMIGRDVQRLGRHGGWLPREVWPRVEPFEVTRREGGRRITLSGWLVRSRSTCGPAPTILHVHGGPHSAHGPLPWLEMLMLAAKGYAVLAPNPRGSVSYGDGFSRSIHGRWGTVDADDLLAVVREAVRRGVADGERLGVMGLSYGGFMVCKLLGMTQGFAAGVAENPVVDLVSEFGTSDIGVWMLDRFAGLGSIDRMSDWLESSPIVRASRMRTPLLLLHAEEDRRCPVSQSEELFTTLATLGREVELVRFPGESHMMFHGGRPDRRIQRLRCIIEWFDRYLMAGG
jgi:acylaminoacyl-peptidase